MSPQSESPKLACRLEPANDLIAVGETLSYVVVNTGEGPVVFGLAESLWWKADGRWQQLPVGGWVAAVGIIVEPGRRSKAMPVEVTKHLSPGHYRLTKDISRTERHPDSITVSCEFAVVMFREEEP